MKTFLIGAILALVCHSPTEARIEPGAPDLPDSSLYGEGHAIPRLLADVDSLLPGGAMTLGISFEIEPGWHLYWNGRNDTGFPILVELDLPEGLTAGETRWPAPVRHVCPGSILDHVYYDRATLLVPIAADRDLVPGTQVTLNASLVWLACKEVCLPGEAKVSLVVPIGHRPPGPISIRRVGPRPEAALFAEARDRLPRTPPLAGGPEIRFESGAATIDVPDARSLAFYPGPECADLTDVLHDGASTSDRLRLRLGPEEPGASLQGVLEVEDAFGLRWIYAIDRPVPSGR